MLTQTDVAFALSVLARLTHDLNECLVRRDAAVLAAQATCQAEIARGTEEILVVETRLKEWADAHRAQFGGQKSLEFPRGVLGYRLGQRSLGLVGKLTWERVLARLKGRWLRYRRIKAEVNKRALLADSAPDEKGKAKLSGEQLAELGVVVIQEETFFVELRGETPGLTAKG